MLTSLSTTCNSFALDQQTWYLLNLLHQQILQNSEIYSKKRIICDILDPIYYIFSISFQRIEMISQFTSVLTLYFILTEIPKNAHRNVEFYPSGNHLTLALLVTNIKAADPAFWVLLTIDSQKQFSLWVSK